MGISELSIFETHYDKDLAESSFLGFILYHKGWKQYMDLSGQDWTDELSHAHVYKTISSLFKEVDAIEKYRDDYEIEGDMFDTLEIIAKFEIDDEDDLFDEEGIKALHMFVKVRKEEIKLL